MCACRRSLGLITPEPPSPRRRLRWRALARWRGVWRCICWQQFSKISALAHLLETWTISNVNPTLLSKETYYSVKRNLLQEWTISNIVLKVYYIQKFWEFCAWRIRSRSILWWACVHKMNKIVYIDRKWKRKSIINSLWLHLVVGLCTHNENYKKFIVHVLEFSKKEHAREQKKRKGRPCR